MCEKKDLPKFLFSVFKGAIYSVGQNYAWRIFQK